MLPRSALLLLLITNLGLLKTFAKADAATNCTTPNGEEAKCIPLFSCDLLLNKIRSKDAQTIKFLAESQCGYGSTPMVCCGTSNMYQASTLGSNNNSQTMSLRSATAITTRDRCGYMTSENKVLSGTDTQIDEFPWMVLLQYNVIGSRNYVFLCGGSLIGPKYVLTAAHCIKDAELTGNYSLKSVRLGEWNTATDQDCVVISNEKDCSDPPINIDVETAIVHPDYNVESIHKHNDIALLRLKESVVFTDFIRPICLPSPTDKAKVGDKLYVAGWGKTETSESSDIKQKLKVPKTSISECNRLFRRFQRTIESTQICAGGEANKDSCTGDSGGPLMNIVKGSPGQWYIEGVVSYGSSCGKQGWPGVYTKVLAYMDWIHKNVRD